jgi:PAS domain S-box-containing protein
MSLHGPAPVQLGKKLREVICVEQYIPIREMLRRVRETGRVERVEYPLYFPNETRWFVSRMIPVTRGARAPGMLCFTAWDITDRKIMEENLRKSQALLAGSEQLANIGSWELDCKRGSIIWSENLYRIHGFSPGEVVASQELCMEMLHPDDREHAEKLLSQALASGLPGEHEYRCTIKDGRVRTMQTRFVPLCCEPGEPRRIVGSTQDVTDRKLAEEKIQKSEALLACLSQELIRTQDTERRLIARNLHESVGQTLAALKMTLANIEETLRENTEESQRHLQAARGLAEDAIREIRVVSYLMHPPMLDEAGLWPTLQWYGRGFSERSGITTTIDADRSLGRLPEQIETAVFRIVQEALTNVHRYSGSSTATIRVSRKEGEVHVEVEDEGCGLQTPTAGQNSRLGVGIAGMRERVKQLHGAFEIQSVAGRGTTVRAVLPIVPQNRLLAVSAEVRIGKQK